MIPCTSDPVQEQTMQKILQAAEQAKAKHLFQDHMAGVFNNTEAMKQKQIKGEEEKP